MRLTHKSSTIHAAETLPAPAERPRPRVCLTMIARQEAKVLRRALESVRPMIDFYVIGFNETTDESEAIAKDVLSEIPGMIFHTSWKGMAANRNEVIAKAEALATANGLAYLFYLDADDVLEIGPTYNPTTSLGVFDCYYISVHYPTHVTPQLRLWRPNAGFAFSGVRHEVLGCERACSIAPLDRPVPGLDYRVVGGGHEASNPQKYLHHAEELAADFEKRPEPRTQFYLANSWRDAGRPDLAIAAYEKRVAMGGWEEEVFVSSCWLGDLRGRLMRPGLADAYLAAYELLPARAAEALWGLALHYNARGHYRSAYGVTSFPHGPCPPTGLFLQRDVYTWKLDFERARAASWIGRKPEGRDIFTRLLGIVPDVQKEIVLGNIAACERMP